MTTTTVYPQWDINTPNVFEPTVILKPEEVHVASTARIDSFVKIEGGLGVHLGEYVHVSSFCQINVGGGEVWLGDHVGVASGGKILGGSNLMTGESMSAASPPEMQIVKRSMTRVQEHGFVGVNAVVLPGLTIGEGAVIGAGAVVTKNVPAWEVWAGVPARKIGERPHGAPDDERLVISESAAL